jgi:hypothetical protein
MRAVFAALLLACGWACGQTPLPPAPMRPGAEAGPTKVNFAVWVGDITKIDSVAQTFTANFMVLLRWHDPRLKHDGPDVKEFDLADIWHPRLLLTNGGGDSTTSLPEKVDVTPDGTALYRQRYIGAFLQPLNLRDFPFDRETFQIRIVLLSSGPRDVELSPDPQTAALGWRDGIALDARLTMQDWSVLAATTCVAPFHVAPGVELASFTCEFTARRNSQHFIIKVIVPLILIVAMSWAVFWIEPTDGGSQFGIAVTAMLTLIAYRFAIDSDVPKLPYLTRLDAFVLMGTVLVFLSLIEVIVTTKFANRDRLDLARTIDRRCRWLFPLVFAAATAFCFS